MTEEKFGDIVITIWRRKQAIRGLQNALVSGSITAKEFNSELRTATGLHDTAVAQLALPLVARA
jgi:hypothetical protein